MGDSGAYSRLLFVEKVDAGTRQLGSGGVLSGWIVEERTSNLEVARASYVAACEEALFQTRQDRDKARAALDQAERLVQVAREHLRTLVGSKLEADVGGQGTADGVADAEGDAEAGGLSTLVLRTPFAGLVEDVFVARGERVHLREEARFRLRLLDDAQAALPLAEENWQIQKEPADSRLLDEARRKLTQARNKMTKAQ